MNTNGSTVHGPQGMQDPNMVDPLASLPNPFTPMAFLPPNVAEQLTICIYIMVAAVTASDSSIVINRAQGLMHYGLGICLDTSMGYACPFGG